MRNTIGAYTIQKGSDSFLLSGSVPTARNESPGCTPYIKLPPLYRGLLKILSPLRCFAVNLCRQLKSSLAHLDDGGTNI